MAKNVLQEDSTDLEYCLRISAVFNITSKPLPVETVKKDLLYTIELFINGQ